MLTTILIILLAILVLYVLTSGGMSEGERAAFERLEAKTDRALEALGIKWDDEVGVAVTKALLVAFDEWERLRGPTNIPPADRRIEAVKLYRRLAGVGLKEAKDRVEDMAHGISHGTNRYVPKARGELDAARR